MRDAVPGYGFALDLSTISRGEERVKADGLFDCLLGTLVAKD